MRSIGQPGSDLRRQAERLADKFFTPTGSAALPGYTNVTANLRALWSGIYHKAYDGLSQKEREELGEYLFRGETPPAKYTSNYNAYKKAHKKFFKEHVSKIHGASKEYKSDHFHRVWSAKKLESDKTKAIDFMANALMAVSKLSKSELRKRFGKLTDEQLADIPRTEEDAKTIAASIVEGTLNSLYGLQDPDGEMNHTEPTRGGANARRIWFVDNNDTFGGASTIDFVETDTAVVLDNYIQQIVKRHQAEKFFGDTITFEENKDGIPTEDFYPLGKLTKFRQSLTSEQDIQFFDDAVAAHFGQLGSDMNPRIKGAQSLFLASVNWAILFLATIGSLPELGGALIRLQDHKDAYKIYLKSLNKKGMAERAQSWGFTDERMERQTGFAYYSSRSGDPLGRMSDTLNDTLFKVNLLQKWTSYTRAVATAAGEDALSIAAKDALGGDTNSISFITDLVGEKDMERVAEAIVRWDAAGRKIPDVDTKFFTANTDQDGLVSYASDEIVMHQVLGRFVDESIVRPSAATQPIWMSDPRFALLAHLKPYFFAMNKQILPQLVNAFTKADMKHLRHATPLIAFGLVMLPLAMISMETRDFLKMNLAGKKSFTDKLSGTEYLAEAFFRANGTMALEPFRNAMDAGNFGDSVIEGFAPSVGVGFDMIKQVGSFDLIGPATPVIASF